MPAQQIANVVLVLSDVIGTYQDVTHLTLHRAAHPNAAGRGFLEDHVCSFKAVAAGELVAGKVTNPNIERHQLAFFGVAPRFIGVL